MIKKIIKTTLLALTITSLSVPVFADSSIFDKNASDYESYSLYGTYGNGWINSGGNHSKWLYQENGKLIRDQFKTINGATYYFNLDGTMESGECYINGIWYTFNSNGKLKNN
ncbi:exported hypothetical protein [Clostridium neonatale]|uniref:hypothetical protein n=1 Tax=Clostridium neonatale TaxID=137838 RepID=UPI00291C23EA|nr:hypothetical protein [Clostridium neonatale]CAI3673310.1 exported hypothetical protein [Clostridium neonatale]